MKRGTSKFSSFIFIFTVVMLLLRPSIIFSSNNFQAILAGADVRAWEIQKIVKKRPETVRISNIISEEDEGLASKNSFLFFYIYANKKWLFSLLIALSSILTQSLYFLKQRSALFKIAPGNARYLALSIIRI